MAPHGGRKKRKGPDRLGKPDLRPNRKELKKHRTEEVEKGVGIEQREQQPAPHAAALFNDADDGDSPRGRRSLLSTDEREEVHTGAEPEFEKGERRGKKKKRNANAPLGIDGDDETLFGGADQTLKVGSIVSGVVERLTPTAVFVSVNGFSKGSIHNEQLADYHGQANQLKNLLKPGHEFNQLLVLDAKGQNLILSAKHSLINTTNDIPSELSQIQAGAIVHGYICNIIEAGCFVRFLGHLTGFAPKDKAVDRRIEKLSDVFFVGQSVRSHVLNVNGESARVTLSLQQSMCSSVDCSFIQGYFLLDQKITALKHSGPGTSHDWMKSFGVGSLVKGEVRAVEEYGVIVNFKDCPDVVGQLEHHQLDGSTVKVGSSVKGLVLDFSDGVVNLSLKPELVGSVSRDGKKKKRHRAAVLDLELNEEVNAVVEIVKDSYVVLSVSKYNHAIGFAPLMDYNSQLLPHHHYANGESITVIVGSIPTSDPSGRLILLPKGSAQDSGLSSSKRAKKKSEYKVGSLVEAEITDIRPLELILKFGFNLHGRIHITEVLEEYCCENPFSKLKIGQKVHARIIAEHSAKSGRNLKWELSVKPSVIKGSKELKYPEAELNHSINGIVRAYVVKVDKEWVSLSISREVMAQLFILDSSVEPSELKQFQQRYSVGQALKGQIIGMNREKRLLRLKALGDQHMLENADVTQKSVSSTTEYTREGDIIGGRIQRILRGIGGLIIQIGPHLHGRVHYTEIVDSWVPEPLSGFHEGQFVKCKVLAVRPLSEGSVRVELSLRSSVLSANHNHSRGLVDNSEICAPRFEKINDLRPGTEVEGYVKNVNARACFIMLSRMVEARIILSNLSDEYVENPQKDFSVGMLVHGRVLSTELVSGKVEVSLRKSTGSKSQKVGDITYSDLHAGDIVDGKVKRLESYGLFVKIQSSELVGFCHVSELCDEPILDINSCFKAGDMVKAKILKINEERHRVSLGLKKSYFDSDLTDSINDNENISHGAEMSKPELPTEILVNIYHSVPCLVTRRHMRQVCGSAFRNAVAPDRLLRATLVYGLPPPSLLLPLPGGPSFCCVLDGCKTHPLHVPSDARASRFFGSFDGGWVFLALGESCGHTLLNLRTKERLRLPDTVLIDNSYDPFWRRKEPVPQDMAMLGATLSAPPNDKEPCICAAISRCRSIAGRVLSFWTIGDEVAYGRPDTVEDITFYNGHFNVLMADETVKVIIPTKLEDGRVEFEKWPLYSPRGGTSGKANVLARYLVGGRGTLFMVVRYGNPLMDSDRPTRSFSVFKLRYGRDEITGFGYYKWSEKHDLSGQIMFVGRCCSRAYDVVRYPDLKEGVYFLDDRDMTWADSCHLYSSTDCGNYTLSSPQIENFLRNNKDLEASSDYSPPVWLLP